MRGRMRSRVVAAILAAAFAATVQAGQWEYMGSAPGETECAARLVGKDVDTMLTLSRNGQLVLVAGKSSWQVAGPKKVELRIDHWQVDHLTATAFRNLILVRVGNRTLLQELEAAKDLYWDFPWGRYHAEVSGLGNAVKWLHNCERAKQSEYRQ